MRETKMNKALYQWRTKKVDSGFVYVISKFTYTETAQPNGRHGIDEIVKTSGPFRTRARAKSAGIKARAYFRSVG